MLSARALTLTHTEHTLHIRYLYIQHSNIYPNVSQKKAYTQTNNNNNNHICQPVDQPAHRCWGCLIELSIYTTCETPLPRGRMLMRVAHMRASQNTFSSCVCIMHMYFVCSCVCNGTWYIYIYICVCLSVIFRTQRSAIFCGRKSESPDSAAHSAAALCRCRRRQFVRTL